MYVNCRLLLICLLVVSLVQVAAATAQPLGSISPGAMQKRSQDTLEFYKLDQLLDRSVKGETQVQELPADQEGKPAEKVAKASFLLRKVVTNASQVLSEADIQAVTAAYEGREVTIEDLFRLVDELNKLYADRRILTAKAFLLPQKVADGVVEIRLIESRFGNLLVEGNADTSTSYIAGHFTLQTGELLTLDKLEKELRRFNRLNDVLVKAELRRGEAPLTTDCVLKVREPLPYSFLLYADNAGQEETGQERLGALFAVRSLSGRRDPLSFGVNTSRGTKAAVVSYSIPVHRSGTRLGASYNVDTIEVVDGIFEPLNITGESSDLDLNLSQPLLVGENTQLGARIGFHWKESTTDFDNVNLFETKVRSAYAGFDYQEITEESSFYGRGEFTGGFDDFGGDSSFFKANLDLAFRTQLPYGFSMLFRGAGQLADTHLLPAMEQFQIGGMATVRGYSEGLKLGDDGYFASLELYPPMPAWKIHDQPLHEMVKGVLFVDHGGAFPYKGNGESIDHTDFLTSVGGGLLFQFSQYLGGRLYLGVPLGDREEDQDSVRLHFFLQSRFL
ncbi:MAG: BamA/TamA family outer membrane protein [Desulfuromonadales bacterium]|nr:BamA/TamA family outer membrane protein [Desulfuromonadales bacterium]